MSQINLHSFAAKLNSKAHSHEIGRLQEIRKDLHGLKRRPGHQIFSSQTTFDDWAFHHGGRSELQFNIGFDGTDGKKLRFGVAFSFETSQALPTIDPLVPKVRLFNDFLRLYPDLYADMRMWHWRDVRSSDSAPAPISQDLVSEGVFVFLGKIQPAGTLDPDFVLTELDRLLPLYEYVESGGRVEPLPNSAQTKFMFKSGRVLKLAATKASYAQMELDVCLRHNVLQQALRRRLEAKFGATNVCVEVDTGTGVSVDLMVRQPEGYWFYEIKTSQSPRACIREALGQLLEYSFWPGSQGATRLIIVGEGAPDDDVREYCKTLNQRFSMAVQYEQIILE